MMKRVKNSSRFFAVLLAFLMVAGTLSGCSRERSEEQSAALVALQKTVSYYETLDRIADWRELIALYGATQTDGIEVNWGSLSIPETPVPDGTALSCAQAILINMTKGSPDRELVKQLAALQEPTSGSFSTDSIASHIWAMISLNVSQGAENYNYGDAVDYLLTFQREDGGFAEDPLSGESDAELSGTAAVALAPFFRANGDNSSMKRLIGYFKDQQLPSGGYGGDEGEDAGATSSVICGLTALGQSYPRSKDEKKSPVDALLAYQNEDGSFRGSLEKDAAMDPEVTRKAAVALCDVVNGTDTYVLLEQAAQDYRLEHTSGPAVTISIDYPYEAHLKDIAPDTITVNQGSTALDALRFYGKSNSIPVEISGHGESATVTAINRVETRQYGNSTGWSLRINGEESPTGAAIYVLQDGDRIDWVYVTPRMPVPTPDTSQPALTSGSSVEE